MAMTSTTPSPAEPIASADQATHRGRFMGDWNLRGCARHGHTTYAPDEAELRERLTVQTPAGEAWRCLRCWSYIPGPPANSGPAALAPEVPRGAVLRDRFLMRALSIERFLRALVLFAAAYGVHRFQRAQAGLADTTSAILPMLRPMADRIGWNLDNSFIIKELDKAVHAKPGTLSLVVIALTAYGVLQVIESVGLWQMKRWGEYFAVIATSIFIPLELWELAHHATVLKIFALIINLAAVVWLVWTKRLFGFRGGAAAYEAQREAASLLSVESAALSSA